jgi:hypothetical protein
MEQKIDINRFIFGRTRAEKKLETIKAMSDLEVRRATSATMLRIIKEMCKIVESDRYNISSNRREGNNWNSTIEFVYEHNNTPYLCLYVQNTKTDSSTCVRYNVFNCANAHYEGYCENIQEHFSYSPHDVAKVVRCILMEYIYCKYIERESIENAKKKASLRKVVVSVVDYYWNSYRLNNLPFSYATTTPRYNQYCKGKQLVEEYLDNHVAELFGKSDDEITSILKKAFEGDIK